MQRWLVIGAVIATLGALYLQLDSGAPPAVTDSGEPRESSPSGARQWLPWAPQLPSEEESRASGDPAGASEEQASSARREDAADLPGTLSLVGYVTDEKGQPIEKVSVRARPSANSLAETRDDVQTDAQGRFRLRSLVPGLYDLSFKRVRFLTRKLETWQLTAPPALLTVQLQRAPSIEGRVVDTAGKPLHGVDVKLFKLDYELAELQPWVPEGNPELSQPAKGEVPRSYVKSTQTEPDGTFILDADEPGDCVLLTQHEGFASIERAVTSPAKDVQLVLGTGTSVEVTVVDGKDRPVPHANVALWQDEDEESLEAELTTDEAGRGVLQGLEPGQYGLAAIPPTGEGFRVTPTSLMVHGQTTMQVRLRFDEGLSLSGVVVDRAGTPIPDVEVKALFLPRRESSKNSSEDVESMRSLFHRLMRGRRMVPHQVQTGPDGRFTVPHLLPFIHRLSFEKSGYTLVVPFGLTEDGEQLQWLDASPGQEDLRVLMIYQGRVSGRVVRAMDGEPVSTFQIDGQSYTSPDGTFTLTAGEPGSHTIDIVAPEVGGLHVVYEAREGKDVELGDLVVGEGRPVRVRVEDAVTALPIADVNLELRGEAPTGAEVWARQAGGTEESGSHLITAVELGLEFAPETGRDGRCLLPDVPTRPLVLSAERKGYEPVSVTLGPTEQEVILRMRAWATVQGWVRANGKPISKGDVNFYSLEGRRQGGLEVRNGWYSGHPFRPGRYIVRAECDECPDPAPVFLSQQVEVPGPQGTVSVDFQESHGSTVEVLTTDEVADVILVQGQPPLPADSREFSALSKASHPHVYLGGSEQGYLFRDVPPGRYTLLYFYHLGEEPGPLQRQELQIPAEGVLRIDVSPR